METIVRLLSHLHPGTLAMTGFRWIRKTMLMLRELRTQEQRILSARDLIAAELESNANVIDDAGGNLPTWGHIRHRVSLSHWHQSSGDLAIFRKRHPELWIELVDMQERVQFARDNPILRLRSEELRDLARRLEEADL